MDGVKAKAEVNSSDMKKFLQAVSEEVAAPAVAPAQQSPEQIAYNQLRAQLDSADALRGGANTHADVSPEVTASTNAMRSKLAQMAAALKAKGIDAEAEYNAPDPAAPAAAPVDLATKYVDENAGMSRLLSIISEGKGPLNRPTTAEALTMQHYTAPKKTITNPVLNVQEGATPSMIGKYFKAVEQELKEAADRSKDRSRQLAERVSIKLEAANPAQQAAIAIAKKKKQQGVSEVAGPEKCWPGHRKVGTKPGTGKNAGKRVNDCEKIGEQGVAEGEKTMSRAAKGNEKYGKDGMKALAKAGREGASEKKLDAIRDKHDNYNEGLEQYRYADILEMARQGLSDEEIAEQLGFDLNEGLKDPKDNPCWKGYKPVGTKKKGGRTVPNCVPKE